jgi:hypothetical protein
MASCRGSSPWPRSSSMFLTGAACLRLDFSQLSVEQSTVIVARRDSQYHANTNIVSEFVQQ